MRLFRSFDASSCFTAATLAAAIVLSGCATRIAEPKDVAVIQGVVPIGTKYQQISELWIDNWLIQLWYPQYGKEEGGMLALKEAAANRGANAILNPSCIEDKTPVFGSWWFCKATALRIDEKAPTAGLQLPPQMQ